MELYTILSDYVLEKSVNNQDLICRAKNTNVIKLIVQDEKQCAVDISGATVFFTVKTSTSQTDADAVLKKDVTSLTEPTSGQTDITLTATDTGSLLGNYIYSVKIKKSDNTIYTLAEGTVCFMQELSTRTS